MSADLHIHSNFSDGTNSPEEIAQMAAAVALRTIALTDHDIIDGIDQAMDEGRKAKVEVIPGIEFTTEYPGSEVHILGYFIDYKNPELLEILGRIQRGRVKRIYKIVEKLKQLKIKIEADAVFAISGKRAPGRPHVARVLISKGIVPNFKEAFNRYLDHRSPAYVPHYKLTPAEAIKMIVKVGGIAVFAHPVISNCDRIIPDLIKEGLRGIEAYYPGYYVDQVEYYVQLAGENNLLVTGGTDFHGEGSGRDIKLGDLTIPDELVDKLKNEHACRNKS